MEQEKAAIEKIKGRLETVSADMLTVMQCLEVLENSIFHLSERKDKDLSKPCAAAAEVILNMLDSCQDAIIEVVEEL